MPPHAAFQAIHPPTLYQYAGHNIGQVQAFCTLLQKSITENRAKLQATIVNQDFNQMHLALHKLRSALVYAVLPETLSPLNQFLQIDFATFLAEFCGENPHAPAENHCWLAVDDLLTKILLELDTLQGENN